MSVTMALSLSTRSLNFQQNVFVPGTRQIISHSLNFESFDKIDGFTAMSSNRCLEFTATFLDFLFKSTSILGCLKFDTCKFFCCLVFKISMIVRGLSFKATSVVRSLALEVILGLAQFKKGVFVCRKNSCFDRTLTL